MHVHELNDAFEKWLKGNDRRPFTIPRSDDDSDVYIRIPKDEQFEYIYHQYTYGGNPFMRSASFEFAGIYNRKDGMVYDCRYDLRRHFPMFAHPDNTSVMATKVQNKVRERIEQIVSHNQATQNGFSLLTGDNQQVFDDYLERSLERDVREEFLSGTTSDSISFESSYNFEGWRDNDLLVYIAAPEYFCELQFKEYWAEHEDDIKWEVARFEAIRDELVKLEELEDSPLHRIKDIMKTANDTDAKKLVVTVNKDGATLSFKIEANELRRDPTSYYGTWNIEAKDRRLFEERFGRHANFYPEEIVDISYCGKSIYSAEPYIPAPSEEQGLTLK